VNYGWLRAASAEVGTGACAPSRELAPRPRFGLNTSKDFRHVKPALWSLLAALLLSQVNAPCHAQQSRRGSPDEPTDRRIVAIEAKWAGANCGHEPELDADLAEDFQGTAPDGHRYPKAEAIEIDMSALGGIGEIAVADPIAP
jgi:hypothetical protein